MPTGKTRPLFPILALALLASRAAAADVTPESLLDSLFQPPKTAYHGRMAVQGQRDKGRLSENVDIFFSPPNRYRWEFRDMDQTLFRLVVSDGQDEYVQSANAKEVLKGGAIRSEEKLMSPGDERALLARNYAATQSPDETIAGRAVWVLVLTPRVPGKPEQRFWIDQGTGLPLKVARAFPEDHDEIASFFTSFDPAWTPVASAFQWDGSRHDVKEHELYPDFLTMEEINKSTGNDWSPARQLPEGFVFESADFYGPEKNRILHWRYTDGLTVVSLFRTTRPVAAPKGKAGESLTPGSGDFIRLSGTAHTYSWKKGPYYYTLMSDLSVPLLKQIAAHFQ